jgi:hypothetical protein
LRSIVNQLLLLCTVPKGTVQNFSLSCNLWIEKSAQCAD